MISNPSILTSLSATGNDLILNSNGLLKAKNDQE
jgi:hypothetical protein